MPVTLLHHLIDHAARRHPEAIAVTCLGQARSYRSVCTASVTAGRWLAAQGVTRRDRVVIMLPAGAATVPLIYGCSRIGAVFVILHEDTRQRGLAHVLDDAEPALLLDDDPNARALALARGIKAAALDQVAGHLDGGTDGSVEPEDLAAPLSTDPVCLIYTSGSTGMPKAVVSTHAQMVFAATAIHSQVGYRPDDVVFVPLPLSFDYGLYQVPLAALGGAHVWLAGARDAGVGLLRALRDSGATVFASVPSTADNLARLLERSDAGLELRLITNTGAAMPDRTLSRLRARIPGLRAQLMFGLTECKRVSIMPEDEDLYRPGACGRPLPGTEVLIVDEDGRHVPAGQVGEIVVRGPHVMSGYWRRPDLTAQRFHRVEGLFPELHSGDYGWQDADGYLYFAGRRDDIYKSRGFRVSATEVEAAANRLPAVRAAAVLPSGPDRERAVLFAVTDLTGEAVLAELRKEIEPYKVPQECFALDALPLTANGKVDKAALASRLA